MVTEHLCIVCPQLRNGEPRVYDRPQACEGCRSRLRALLAEVVDTYASLELVKGSTDGAKVSGSRTPPLPLVLSALDLTMPPHPPTPDDLVPLYTRRETEVRVWDRADPAAVEYTSHTVTLSQKVRKRDDRGYLAYGPSGDQTGDPSAPTVLDMWARDWQTYRWSLLPDPDVSSLVRWLLDRLDWACDEHPAIGDFADEVSDLARRLRPRAPRPELKIGVPCRECDRVTLYRWPGSDYIECSSCDLLMTPDEFDRWTSLISSKEHLPWVRQIIAGQQSEPA